MTASPALHRRPVLTLALLAGLCLLPSACAEEDEATGTAPVIDTLALMPQQVTVNETATLSGGFNFTDPDGDIDTVRYFVASPDGQSTSVQELVVDTAGLQAGMLQLALTLQLPAAGTYTVNVAAVDARDLESNWLEMSIEAVAP